MPPFNNYPLAVDPAGIYQGPEVFQTTEMPGESLRTKNYSQII